MYSCKINNISSQKGWFHNRNSANSLKDNRISLVQAAQLKSAIQSNQSEPVQKKNNTGLPDSVKSGVERLSGVDMSDVKVHYNSSKPAAVQAHAYTQGTSIHVAPGQSKHVAHEAWHVVQQKQGRVKPTTSVGGVAVNDSPKLEREADVMGAKARWG